MLEYFKHCRSKSAVKKVNCHASVFVSVVVSITVDRQFSCLLSGRERSVHPKV